MYKSWCKCAQLQSKQALGGEKVRVLGITDSLRQTIEHATPLHVFSNQISEIQFSELWR